MQGKIITFIILQIANRFLEIVEKFEDLGTTVTNIKCIHEEIKGRLNMVDACFRSVQNFFSPLSP
jgi:hypothetical protein